MDDRLNLIAGRSRPLFTFHRPETFQQWLKEEHSLRFRLKNQLPTPGNPTDDFNYSNG